VLATQNPIEQEGTYPLPEAQQDRFMFHIRVDYPAGPTRSAISRRPRPGPGRGSSGVSGEDSAAMQDWSCGCRRPPTWSGTPPADPATRPAGDGDVAAPDFVKKYVGWGAGPRAGPEPDPGGQGPGPAGRPDLRGRRRRRAVAPRSCGTGYGQLPRRGRGVTPTW
jgi:hypothetical protein